ncbi:MAG: spore protein [Paenibacillus sp.]|nr:spore protein [Paenibacillus sp.]
MSEHPIQGLMKTAMENIKEMVDVNTIVGDPVETPDGSVIMPISKVGFGFAAGGSEFSVEPTDNQDHHHAGGQHQNGGQSQQHRTDSYGQPALPFGGGSGGGVSITPIAFLVVGKHGVKVVPLDNQTHLYERLIDSAPHVVDKIQSMLKANKSTMSGVIPPSDSGIISNETNVIV